MIRECVKTLNNRQPYIFFDHNLQNTITCSIDLCAKKHIIIYKEDSCIYGKSTVFALIDIKIVFISIMPQHKLTD
jgi:hypothetical protein